MYRHVISAVLLSSSLALADGPSTRPATASPNAKSAPATAPAGKSARPLVEMPTPAELAKKLKAMTQRNAAQLQVAYFNLSQPITEKPADFAIFAGPNNTLHELLGRLETARKDSNIKGILLDMSQGTSLNLSQAQEMRSELNRLRQAGKRVFTYADSYDTTNYVLASAATDVCMLEGGELFMPGIAFETMFYKGVFDKLGVYAEYVQIGEFKGAEEPYTRSAPSEELQGELTKLADAMYGQIVQSISQSRNVSQADVKQLIDQTMVSGANAKTAGWVDHLIDPDGLRDLMADELGGEVNLVRDYDQTATTPIDLSNPFAALATLSKQQTPAATGPTVAIVYAEGTIVDGSGGGSLLSPSADVGSERIRQAMRVIARDDNIKAVVIRINSPGGSALASEAMWQAVRRVAKDKPVVVSIGGMAASGGYYLASAGDYVVADATAIVGSIGVVGGKFVLSDLYDKLGISTATFSKGRNADLYSQTARYDDRQKRLVKTMMRNTYDQFTTRIMTTRGKKIKDIDKVARGRIFMAADALDLGMVDEIGGMDVAIADAATRAKLPPDGYQTQVVPAPATVADVIAGRASLGQASALLQPQMQIAPDSLLRLLPASARALVAQQIKMAELMESRPVILMSPYVMSVR